MNLISDYEAHKRDEEWNEREDRRVLLELERIQGMINLAADLLKNATTPASRESLSRQLTYYLKRKRELTFSPVSSASPQPE